MTSKYLATALLSALMTGIAAAQTATTKTTTAENTASMHRDGEWRASKLVGVDVYNEANEKVGDINDVILDKSGWGGPYHSWCWRLPSLTGSESRRRLPFRIRYLEEIPVSAWRG